MRDAEKELKMKKGKGKIHPMRKKGGMSVSRCCHTAPRMKMLDSRLFLVSQTTNIYQLEPEVAKYKASSRIRCDAVATPKSVAAERNEGS